MTIRVTNCKVLDGKSGRGLRFDLTYFWDDACQSGHTLRGCMAWREKNDTVKLNGPRITLKGSRRPYDQVIFTDAERAMIQDGLEKTYGHKIMRWPGRPVQGVPIQEEDPGAPSELEFRL